MVIRFFVYLVERGFFLKANLIFLVKGHTKNICDQILNHLKLGYHNKNIYSTEELMELMNTHDQVTAMKVNKSTELHYWEALFEIFTVDQAASLRNHTSFPSLVINPLLCHIQCMMGSR